MEFEKQSLLGHCSLTMPDPAGELDHSACSRPLPVLLVSSHPASSRQLLCHSVGLAAGKSVKESICCLLKQTKVRKREFCLLFLLLFCLLSLLKTIESNWRCGRHSLQRIHCRSETSKGVYCLQYDDQKIVSGLRDNTIKVRTL